MSERAPELSPDDPRAALAEEVLGALKVLRGIGMALAEGLLEDARPKAAGGDEPADPRIGAAEAALAYSRIARAVRLTVALELRVAQEADEIDGDLAEQRAQAERHARAQRREAGFRAKEAGFGLVSSVLMEAVGGIDEHEHQRLDENLVEWLHDDEEDEAFAQMSQEQILDDICQALGVTPDPKLWAAGELVAAIRAAVIPASRHPARSKERQTQGLAQARAPDARLELADPP
jgi:hypothetical protein